MFQRAFAGVQLRFLFSILSSTILSTSLLSAQSGDTLLAVAAREGDLHEVRRLLDAGADPDVGLGDYTPLMLAAMNGETEIAGLLLDHGAEINFYDNDVGTPLCLAAVTPIGDNDVLALLLERGAQTEVGNGTDMTPLMYAAREGKRAAVRLLVEAGANAAHTDVRGWSPLMFGVRSGDPEIVRLLLAAGADPDVPTEYPTRRPIHFVAETGDTTIALILLDAGADVDGGRTGEEVPPPIAIAVIEKQFDLVRILLRRDAGLNRSFIYYPDDGVLLSESGAVTLLDIVERAGEEELAQEIRDSVGIGYRELQTVVADMHGMVTRGNLQGVDHALRLDLDPAAWIEVGDESVSLLDIAYLSRDTSIIVHLLEAADLDYWRISSIIEQQEMSGNEDMVDVTIRHEPLAGLLYGIERTNDRIIDLALEAVGPDKLDGYRVRDLGTALHVAVSVGDLPTLERLLALGVPVDPRSDRGQTPLHVAVWSDNEFMTTFLLEQGAEVDAVDTDGETPLILGARKGSTSVLDLLLSAGADPNAIDRRWGKSALHYAIENGDPELAETLVSAGADPEQPDYRGESPRELADRTGKPGLIRVRE